MHKESASLIPPAGGIGSGVTPVKGFTLSIIVANRYGVLARVAGLFSKRGYNIDSLHVDAMTEDINFSRIIMTSRGDDAAKTQIVKQLAKLHDVKDVKII